MVIIDDPWTLKINSPLTINNRKKIRYMNFLNSFISLETKDKNPLKVGQLLAFHVPCHGILSNFDKQANEIGN